MTHDIITVDHYIAGESLTQEFTVEEDGSAKDISGAEIEWSLLPNRGADAADAELDDSDSGVSASIVDAANGRVDVAIDQDVTTGLGGDRYWQRLVVDDSGSGKQIWGGTVRIDRP